jgi:hypothetical protein
MQYYDSLLVCSAILSLKFWHVSQTGGIFNVTQQATKKKAP